MKVPRTCYDISSGVSQPDGTLEVAANIFSQLYGRDWCQLLVILKMDKNTTRLCLLK